MKRTQDDISSFFLNGQAGTMSEIRTWRDLLAQIISEPKEKQRIIEELGISSITLTRWIQGDSVPRLQNLRHLLGILPRYRPQFQELFKQEQVYEELANPTTEEGPRDIPPEFYARVFAARATTVENLRFWSSCNLILQQAIGQLDPERMGMAIWIVRCMDPSGPDHKVRSLRETTGIGTPPWQSNLEAQALFLGAESLAGNVVTLCRPAIIEDLDQDHHLLPAVRTEFEKSVAIYPILYAGRIAGTLTVSSTQYNYFSTPTRTNLIQKYADLVALVFDPAQFYEPDQISLSVMPDFNAQREYFSEFRRTKAELLLRDSTLIQAPSALKVDHNVWQTLESELLQLSAVSVPPTN